MHSSIGIINNMSIIKIEIVTRAMLTGGAERVIAQLANYLANHGIKCRIITMDQSEVMYPLNADIVVEEIGRKSENKIVDRVRRYRALRNKVISDQPDVLLTMPEDTGIYVILAMIGTGIPVYVSERNNPWVMPDSKITRFLRVLAYPFAKGIIFQTRDAKSFFSPRIRRKGVILRNPVDLSRIPLPCENDREKWFASIGRLEPQKNFTMLIEAFAVFHVEKPEYSLRIYGEGSERTKLQELVDRLGLQDSVSLPGRDLDVLNKINSAAAFILTSDYEGMPNALIEAMCMGMPVISTDCPSGGPRELISNGNNGYLVKVGDSEQLVDAMRSIVNEDIACSFSTAARKLRDSYADQIVFDQWKDYLCSSLKDG